MNFFEHQQQARRQTGRLVVLFIIAVILILAAVNAAAYGILRLVSPQISFVKDAAPVFRGDMEYPDKPSPIEPMWNSPLIHAGVSIATLLIIAGGSLYKTAALSRGGHAVALMLGGRPLDPQGAQGQDRVLQNVVEEMSIASGIPVPTVYVLENEQAINAFAAGFTTKDAVIGVTRGTIENLNRDELQGVIAHEFSHILNGDMRLNIRLIGILHGILVIGLIGYALMRSLYYIRPSGGRRDKNGGNIVIVMALAGGALLVIGYVGVFFGRLIQAAVSRQREFLADASAVQFTRNPRGIAGALWKIGHLSGSQVNTYHAVETAHMFFASGVRIGLTNLLATHPPLAERIRRIDPHFQGTIEHAAPRAEEVEAPALDPAAFGFAAGLPRTPAAAALAKARRSLDATSVVDHAGTTSPASVRFAHDALQDIPDAIIDAAHEPFGARALVLCLVLADEPQALQRQLAAIHEIDPACHRAMLQLLEPVAALGPMARLPLADLTLPALRRLSPAQMKQFRQLVQSVIKSDARVTLFEYTLLKIIDQCLKPPDADVRGDVVKFYAVNAVKDEAAVLLTALANASSADTATAFAAGAQRLDPEDPPGLAPKADLLAVDAALYTLRFASPAVKQRIIDACAHCVASDGYVSVTEAELLRAIASTMDVPIPPLVQNPARAV